MNRGKRFCMILYSHESHIESLQGSLHERQVEVMQTDAGLPSSEWSPEQQQIYVEMSTVMQDNADIIQGLGIRSANAVLYDFATLAAQYRRAFVQSFPSYFPADAYLANTAAELVAAIHQACLAVT